ncbi:MAG: DUF5723 family protein [Bacteroidales bacterium]|nr:DUF5723 family protein [Bacteroidales bacterium]
MLIFTAKPFRLLSNEHTTANILNPSFTPPYNFYISIPIFSSVYMGFENAFTFNELTSKRADDSLYIDRNKLISKLKPNNYFSFEMFNELIGGGFKIKKNYFHLSISKIYTNKFIFTDNFISFLLYGNGNEQFLGKNIQFNDTKLNMTLYHEFALGMSHEFNEKFHLGLKVKYLNGFFNVWTKKSYFNIYTDTTTNYALTTKSDILLYTSSTISDFDNMIDQIDDYGWLTMTDNHGYAFDIGMNYILNENFSVSASLINIGAIKWKENIKNYKSEKANVEFTFEGFDINDIFINNEFNDSLNVLDTLAECLGLIETNEYYTSHLNPKLYLCGAFNINSKNALGLLIRNDFVEKTIQPSITVSYNKQFGSFINAFANYSILNKSYCNFGFGIVLKLGPVQIYAINDNFYALFYPNKSRNYNLHFGLNLVFGKPGQTSIDNEERSIEY